MPASMRAFLEKAAGVLQYLSRKEVEAEMFTELHRAVVVPLVGRSRLDGNLLHARLSMQETFARQADDDDAVRREAGDEVRAAAQRGQRRFAADASRGDAERVERDRVGVVVARRAEGALAGGTGDRRRGAVAGLRAESCARSSCASGWTSYAYADWAEHWMHESLKHAEDRLAAVGR